MSKKMMLLALAAVSAVLFALPAAASAGEWLNTTKGNFTVANNGVTPITLTASNGDTVTCTGVTGSGTWSTTQTGSVANGLTFSNCTSSGFACTSSGEESGKIKTNALAFETVYLNSGKTTPGITLKPSSGTTFVAFSCAGIFTITVHGSINGHIEGGCASRSSYGLEFASGPNHGEVKWPRNTEKATEPFDDLTVTKSFSANSTGSMDATGIITFGGVQTMDCV